MQRFALLCALAELKRRRGPVCGGIAKSVHDPEQALASATRKSKPKVKKPASMQGFSSYTGTKGTNGGNQLKVIDQKLLAVVSQLAKDLQEVPALQLQLEQDATSVHEQEEAKATLDKEVAGLESKLAEESNGTKKQRETWQSERAALVLSDHDAAKDLKEKKGRLEVKQHMYDEKVKNSPLFVMARVVMLAQQGGGSVDGLDSNQAAALVIADAVIDVVYAPLLNLPHELNEQTMTEAALSMIGCNASSNNLSFGFPEKVVADLVMHGDLFTTEGGSIESSCLTSKGACTVTWTSQ